MAETDLRANELADEIVREFARSLKAQLGITLSVCRVDDDDPREHARITVLVSAALAAVQQETTEKLRREFKTVLRPWMEGAGHLPGTVPYADWEAACERVFGPITTEKALRAPKAPRPEATRSASSQQLIRRLREMATEVITQPWLERKALLMQNALNDAADEIERLKRVNATHTTE